MPKETYSHIDDELMEDLIKPYCPKCGGPRHKIKKHLDPDDKLLHYECTKCGVKFIPQLEWNTY